MELSSLMVFIRRISGKGWSKRVIRRKFLKEVDPTDYDESNRAELIKFLFSV